MKKSRAAKNRYVTFIYCTVLYVQWGPSTQFQLKDKFTETTFILRSSFDFLSHCLIIQYAVQINDKKLGSVPKSLIQVENLSVESTTV